MQIQIRHKDPPLSPAVFMPILENNIVLFDSKLLAKCLHSILNLELLFSLGLRVLPSPLRYFGVMYCQDYARVI